MNVFNNSNPSAVFVNATSDLLNKHMFTNPAAGLTLTLYIGSHFVYIFYFIYFLLYYLTIFLTILGGVPLDFPDALLIKMVEVRF